MFFYPPRVALVISRDDMHENHEPLRFTLIAITRGVVE